MTDLTEGAPAPAFDMPTDDSGRVSLETLKGKLVVLYFYPRADTPGCTTEGKDFSALLDQFEAANAVVIGVSKDTPAKLARFRAKHDLKIMLASDEASDVCERYGVWGEKMLYGRKFMGLERATFLIGADGTIRQVWRKVRVAGHADAVLDAVKTA